MGLRLTHWSIPVTATLALGSLLGCATRQYNQPEGGAETEAMEIKGGFKAQLVGHCPTEGFKPQVVKGSKGRAIYACVSKTHVKGPFPSGFENACQKKYPRSEGFKCVNAKEMPLKEFKIVMNTIEPDQFQSSDLNFIQKARLWSKHGAFGSTYCPPGTTLEQLVWKFKDKKKVFPDSRICQSKDEWNEGPQEYWGPFSKEILGKCKELDWVCRPESYRMDARLMQVILTLILTNTPTPKRPAPAVAQPPDAEPPSAGNAAFRTTFEGKEYTLTREDMDAIGEQIYLSETGGKPENLAFWSPKEAFPSLGIGHFIWFPQGCGPCTRFGSGAGPFLGLAEHLRSQGVALPEFVFSNGGFPPWGSRQGFLNDTDRVLQLRAALESSKGEQAQYIIEGNMGKLSNLAQGNRDVLVPRMEKVLNSKGGAFLLVDYINFKGEGAAGNQNGWGLRQVLEAMQENPDTADAFADAADAVLDNRVANNPADGQFSAGWRVRTDRYRTFVLPSRQGAPTN
jgi:hypothetical protein